MPGGGGAVPGPAMVTGPEPARRRCRRAGRSAVLYWLAVAVVTVCLIAGFGFASRSAEGLALLGALMLAARALQVRSRRRRPAGMIGPGEDPGTGDEVPLGYGAPMARAAEAFSQQYCSVIPVTGGGNINVVMPATGFRVVIAGTCVSVIEAPGLPLFTVPATAVQISTPRWQRRIFGAGSILKIGGHLWSVQFGSAYRAEAAHARRMSGLGVMAAVGAPVRSICHGREINARFTCALLEAGASDALQPAAAVRHDRGFRSPRPDPGAGRRSTRQPLRPLLNEIEQPAHERPLLMPQFPPSVLY